MPKIHNYLPSFLKMSQISIDDEISIEFIKLLDKYFPKLFYSSNGSSGRLFYATMSEYNKDFQGSPYFYTDECKQELQMLKNGK